MADCFRSGSNRRHQPHLWLTAAAAVWCLTLGGTAPSVVEARQKRVPPGHDGIALFTHSDNCVGCHNDLTTAAGEDVSIGSMWRGTIMANSARDPYWQASVRRETIDHGGHAAEIQDECAACHMPMPQRIARAGGGAGEVFKHLPIDKDDSELQRLAADSISCTVCHQIAPDTLGTRASYNANFVMAPTPADGSRRIFGGYTIDAGRRTIMRSVSGFVQEEAPHIRESELCATCHTLITKARGPDGAVLGELPEQMNYEEWRHSAFAAEKRTCQSCHMPAAPGPVRIASVLGDTRDRLARHTFVGGNVHMLRLLNRYRAELGVTAQPAELEAAAAATERQLQRDTATLALTTPQIRDGALEFDVVIRNLTGHKFPTGYPSRRAWLRATVVDGSGRPLFESGAIGADGAIAGNDSDADARRFEPHHSLITDAAQVPIYESILGTPAGAPTTGLLSATQYLKDNRLLPRGFDKRTASRDIAVVGGALDDDDFSSEGDRVRYRIAVPAGENFAVRVELRYQSIAFRWAANLAGYDAAEPRRFTSYYQSTAAGSSIIVASVCAATGSRSNDESGSC